MNYPLVFGFLGTVCHILGVSMLFSLPWAHPVLGGEWDNERSGAIGLVVSMAICFMTGFLLRFLGRGASESFSRKEATAIVALSWILATILGMLPFLLSGTERMEGVPLSVCDALFESQSGFSTTGATIFGELERSDLLPRCILFWRSTTHFLGGLGIMVLFVALLGHGTFGKTMMRFEWSGKSSPRERMQLLAKALFKIYVTLNILLTTALVLQGLTLFDALCHSFGTVATAGFSTFNASAGHFVDAGYSSAVGIEWTLMLFMFIGGTNFVLLYWFALRKPERLFRNTEWRVYLGIIFVATILIICSGINDNPTETPIRTVLFHVVALATTTGYVTAEYEKWNGFACGVFLLLMFIGGCAGSTAGGFKVLRAVSIWKLLPQEIEKAYRPNVVRPLLLDGTPMEKDVIQRILVHLSVMAAVFVTATLFILAFEPATAWGTPRVGGDRKLIDSASAVVSCMNNVGPGLGLVGARQNFGNFSEPAKFLFAWLMMLGRLEFFVVLSLFHRGFWSGWRKPFLTPLDMPATSTD